MGGHAADARGSLLALYDPALPQVYGYLLRRCGDRSTAEELTSETFLAAADAVRRGGAPALDIGWLIGVARHKLADHWRRAAREQRTLRAVGGEAVDIDDPWPARLDMLRAREVMARVAPQHRAALTLRYADDLPVADVADILQRTLHATEALLVRARREFRTIYLQGEENDR